jgi:DNA polymerase III epsilon subunit-like protein
MTLAPNQHVLIFDTETTGLPRYGSDHPAGADYQPRMCAVSMATVSTTDGSVVERFTALVKPERWPLDNPDFLENMEAAERIHNLPLERLKAEGIPIEIIQEAWQRMYAQSDFVSGYNVWFDHKIVRGELARLGQPIPFRDKQGICLMKAARMRLGKRVSLTKACELILGKSHRGAHDAAADVDATIGLFRHFLRIGGLDIELQPEARRTLSAEQGYQS